MWERVRDHVLDQPDSPFPLTTRLAREQGWPLALARTAVEEYRKFAFLAMAAGHPVSPSHAIDQVWHLHLLYTRDYWDVWCARVLGRPLHHEPSTGGAKEGAKFDGWYGRTLESYRRFFGEPGPAWCWPTPEAKRRGEGIYRYVDLTRHWCLPRLWGRRP